MEENNYGFAPILIKDNNYLFVDVDDILFVDEPDITKLVTPEKDSKFEYERHFSHSKESIQEDIKILKEIYRENDFGFVVIYIKDLNGKQKSIVKDKIYYIDDLLNSSLFDEYNQDYDIPDEVDYENEDDKDIELPYNKINPNIEKLEKFETILEEKRNLRKNGNYYSGQIDNKMRSFVNRYRKELDSAYHGHYDFDNDESIFRFIYSISNEKVLFAIINNYKSKI